MARQRVQLTKQKGRRKGEEQTEAAEDQGRATRASRRAQRTSTAAARWLRRNP